MYIYTYIHNIYIMYLHNEIYEDIFRCCALNSDIKWNRETRTNSKICWLLRKSKNWLKTLIECTLAYPEQGFKLTKPLYSQSCLSYSSHIGPVCKTSVMYYSLAVTIDAPASWDWFLSDPSAAYRSTCKTNRCQNMFTYYNTKGF